MVYGPLAHGLLTGAFTPETRFDEDDWRCSKGGSVFGLPLFLGDHFARNVRLSRGSGRWPNGPA